jgi:predicted transcriptional regulator
MMLNVRLDEETERKLEILMRVTGQSRSEIVRAAIRSYEPLVAEGETVYDRLADIVGVAQLGGGRARRGEQILREAFARKRAVRK